MKQLNSKSEFRIHEIRKKAEIRRPKRTFALTCGASKAMKSKCASIVLLAGLVLTTGARGQQAVVIHTTPTAWPGETLGLWGWFPGDPKLAPRHWLPLARTGGGSRADDLAS